MPNAVVVVQARMGSTRKPGKSLALVDDAPLIVHVLNRALSISQAKRVVLATSVSPEDDRLAEFVKSRYPESVQIFRGDQEDVQSRFLEVGELYSADFLARITADDPFKDPAAYDQLLALAAGDGLDYASLRDDLLPIGLDAEVFRMSALLKSREQFDSGQNREHVTPELRSNPFFARHFCGCPAWPDLAHVRLTIDYDSDIPLSAKLAKSMRLAGASFDLAETISHLRLLSA